MNRIFSAIIGLFLSSSLIAQNNPFGVMEDQSTLVYNFVQLDPLTGNITSLVPITGMTSFVIPDQSVITYHNNHYVFSGFAGSVKTLYTVDITNTTVLSSVPFPQNVLGYQYNCNDSLIYGLYEFNNNYELVTIDPSTGTINTISPISAPLSAYSGGTFVLDNFKNLYSFVVNDFTGFKLYAFDITSGNLIHNNAWPDNVVGQVFNGADSTIYGVLEVGTNYNLVSIDQISGNYSTIGTLNGVTPGFLTDATCISQNGTYIFRGFDATNNLAVFTVNPTNASVQSLVSLSDNMVGYELPVCNINIPVSENEITNNRFVIYPNPINNLLHISANINGKVKAELFNSLGSTIFSKENLLEKGTRNKIDCSNIEPGMYFLRLMHNNGVYIQKIIKN